jgi:hypothetical protein
MISEPNCMDCSISPRKSRLFVNTIDKRLEKSCFNYLLAKVKVYVIKFNELA